MARGPSRPHGKGTFAAPMIAQITYAIKLGPTQGLHRCAATRAAIDDIDGVSAAAASAPDAVDE